jgi:mannose-1-phosphate guanylyltransferase/mannose-6-phosphate isomerase
MIRPVILCGGAGTRLWPLSRELYPKQLLSILGDRSLLRQTAARLSGDLFAPPIIVGGEEQRFFIKRQLEDEEVPPEVILLEPTGRNTAAAATLAAAWLASLGRDELLLLMPSDHVILDRDSFLRAIATGAGEAEKGRIVTFGARPTEPNTQYGYIEAAPAEGEPDRALPIVRFVEKPDAAKAAEYLASGRFYWNAGIFLVKVSALLDEMREHLPATLDAVVSSISAAQADGLFVRPDARAFERAPNISIDYGIMEKTSRGAIVPVDMGWSDVGAWDAVWKLGEQDASGNVLDGDVLALDTHGSLLRSEGGPLVAGVGLKDMAVIAVRDAVFVSPLDRAAEVKKVVESLKAAGHESAVSPPKVLRPWGSYEGIADGPRFQVKHIIVDPGQSLSLQMHVHRSEHWVVVRGSAEVTVGDRVSMLQENESTYIPAGKKHRLKNPGKVPLELVEVQCGPYLGEDDIVRFEDIYGRSGGESSGGEQNQ